MKKKLLAAGLAAVMTILILPITAMASGGYYAYAVTGGNIYYSTYLNEATITDCDNSVTEAVIPSIIVNETTGSEATVTAIGKNAMAKGAFEGRTNLVSVTIPDSVTEICDSAFASSKALQNVTFGRGITAIPNRMFWCCEGMKTIEIPEWIERIGDAAFQNCYALESIKIPGTVKHIGEDAFSCDRNLTDIEICEGVETIGEEAFYFCGMESIDIPASVVNIGEGAFYSCKKLKSIKVDPDNPNYSSEDGVLFDKDKRMILCYPTGKTDTSYEIPEGVNGIGTGAFAWCSNLTEIKLPTTIKDIGDKAFYYCESLVGIDISSSVAGIGEEVFEWCRKLEYINVDSKNRVYSSENGVLFDKDKTELITYPPAKADEEYSIPAGVTTIGAYAFNVCKNLKTVIIPEGVTAIKEGAFKSCTNVEVVEIPKSLTTIESRAFAEWIKLADIYYGGSEEDWESIDIADFGNEKLSNATIHYNSKSTKTFTDDASGIKADVPANSPVKDAEFVVNEKKPADTGISGLSVYGVLYDIYFEKDGRHVQPDGDITVSIPIPDGMDGEKCKVFYIDEKGNKTDMNAVLEDEYLVFKASHFSYYSVETEKPESQKGDVNGDGKVNAKDKAILNRYLAGWDGYEAQILSWDAADIDGDEKVNAKDKAILNRYLAGWTGYDMYFEQ